VILTLTRRWRTADTTTGTLTVDGIPECYSLEDVVRVPSLAEALDELTKAAEVARVKVPGQTAILRRICENTAKTPYEAGRCWGQPAP